MTESPDGANVLPLRLRAERAQAIINDVARVSVNVFLGAHARQRMEAGWTLRHQRDAGAMRWIRGTRPWLLWEIVR